MKQLLNTLFLTTQRAYLHLAHETVKVRVGEEIRLQVPLHHLGAIVCFGSVEMSTALIHKCAEDGRSVVFLGRSGRFKARVVGPVTGNVLLRTAQHDAARDEKTAGEIARNLVAGKIQNSRQVLLRAGREADVDADRKPLRRAARTLAGSLRRLESLADLDRIRGIEGDAARTYFANFDRMVRESRDEFRFVRRSRRPPRDRLNALLSFLYALLLNECVASAEGVGLDPQVGFLHALRPGRPSLALDLMEELRPVLVDRLALTLINRRQVTAGDFTERTGGAVHLSDGGRKAVLVAYQKRKQAEVQHAVLEAKTPLGLVPHLQARLLARRLRGDLELYPPFLYR